MGEDVFVESIFMFSLFQLSIQTMTSKVYVIGEPYRIVIKERIVP
jgi:hypothetical protein